MSRLVVHLNGSELYDVEPAVNSFESTGPFEVELCNHGQPVHVHLRLDGDLARVASLSGSNYFVEAESVTRVPVTVAESAPAVHGTLKVVTGYGSGTDHVEVRISDEAEEDGVAVDGDLGRPQPAAEGAAADGMAGGATGSALARLPLEGPLADRVDARGVLALGAVVAVALAASAAAILAARGPAVVVGIFAVLVGLAVAGYLVVRPA